MIEIRQGDCRDILKSMEADSIDALVTDPPAGISFMGKDWDKDKGGRDPWIAWLSSVMKECMRVMKPGAHGLVWAIPRTSHWTAMALEDAGFEIRDVVTHLFGSGFPKSMDISKAIDKAAGAEREVIGDNPNHRGASQMRNPYTKSLGQNGSITAPATPEAKQWQGWGTALKPASEHWILIRKPLSEKTVAANVFKYGCGGINIDASRIGGIASISFGRQTGNGISDNGNGITHGKMKRIEFVPNTQGRFPANLVLSHNPDCEDKCSLGCAVAELDKQSGFVGGSPGVRKNNKSENLSMSGANSGSITRGYDEPKSGASRFFYCAKASKSDKGQGNIHPTVKSSKLMSYLITMVTPPNGVVLDPFAGSGSTGIAAIQSGFSFIGIEKESEYIEIVKKRIYHAFPEFKKQVYQGNNE